MIYQKKIQFFSQKTQKTQKTQKSTLKKYIQLFYYLPFRRNHIHRVTDEDRQ